MDVADILGVKSNISSGLDEILQTKAKPVPQQKQKYKPKGMNRELFLLVGDDGIAPSIQTNSSTGFKNKRMSGMQGRWVWAPIRSSARSDAQTFYHWARADIQDMDYAYAKFNIKLESVQYTDEEYDNYLQCVQWSRSETDHLMCICYEYDLRWPVIVDRYEATPKRPTEELMHRYYSVLTKLKAGRLGQTDFSSKSFPASQFDIAFEKNRRNKQEMLFKMSSQEEMEETKLREELRNVEIAIKKLKKSSKQFAPSGPQPSQGEGVVKTAISRSFSTSSDIMDSAPVESKPANLIPAATSGVVNHPSLQPITMYAQGDMPAPGKPCLQSSRLFVCEDNVNLARSMTKKASLLLAELGFPEKPLPTRPVCDIVDQIRKDAITLLSLQNTISKKEKELAVLKADQAIAQITLDSNSTSDGATKASTLGNKKAQLIQNLSSHATTIPHATLLLSGSESVPSIRPASAAEKLAQATIYNAAASISTGNTASSVSGASSKAANNPPKKINKRKAVAEPAKNSAAHIWGDGPSVEPGSVPNSSNSAPSQKNPAKRLKK